MEVQITELTKSYGDITAVDGIDLVAAEGELTTLLGPSGCGKTTTLRSIAGLEDIDGGSITIGDAVVSDFDRGINVSTQDRNIGFVFQSFDVWPHMDVFDNVAYPLRVRNVPDDEIEAKVHDILDIADIEHLSDHRATDLSGGQQARVGICRALVYEPDVLLCDEPLSGLDRNLRQEMRYEIRRIQLEVGTTTIYVTHNQEEAMSISDKICLMNTDGKIEQTGNAEDIYYEPDSLYALDFFGASEHIPGEVADGRTIRTSIGDVVHGEDDLETGDECVIGFRPEAVEISAERGGGENTWEGVIDQKRFLGGIYEFTIDLGGITIQSRHPELATPVDVGDSVFVRLPPEELFVFPEVI